MSNSGWVEEETPAPSYQFNGGTSFGGGGGYGGGGERRPRESRPGDWDCACGKNNFARNTDCFGCKKPKPAGLGFGGGEGRPPRESRPGDWDCPSCHRNNFSSKVFCYTCNEPKPESAGGGDFRGNSGGRERRPGDWDCPDCQFKGNFASRSQCNRCQADKPSDTGSSSYDSTPKPYNFGGGSTTSATSNFGGGSSSTMTNGLGSSNTSYSAPAGRGFVEGPKKFDERGFGARGRGFGKPSDSQDERRPGSSNDVGGGGGGYGGGSSYSKPSSGQFDVADCSGAEEAPRPPPFIPDAPPTNEEELFKGIPSGINFEQYSKIECRVEGENAPPPFDSFETSGLGDLLLSNITKMKYTKPTPVQRYAIPIIRAGRDLMALAQTGSGKTAAFLLPMMKHIMENNIMAQNDRTQKIVGFIISPTRELAHQINEEASKFAWGSIVKIVCSYGGTSAGNAMRQMENGCHIFVATPGRFKDFMGKGKFDFSELKFIVLDEADRMLDMGFRDDIREIMSHSTMPPPGQRQMLLFSATVPDDIERMAREYMHNRLYLRVGMGGACKDVLQEIFEVDKKDKKDKLMEIFDNLTEIDRIIVFVEQKKQTDFLASMMCQKNYRCTSIHGDREQRERNIAIRDFKDGKFPILFATDVAARGLDIKGVSKVVNYDLPDQIDTYVHRIGRTGRVGNPGHAISFFDPTEQRNTDIAAQLVDVLAKAQQKVPEFLQRSYTLSGGYGGRGGGGRSYGGGNDFVQAAAAQNTPEDDMWG